MTNSENKNIVLYCDPFIPPEWIAAHGLRPLQIAPAITNTAAIGMCPYATAFINELNSPNACAAIFATTCDQMRRAADIATQNSSVPVFLFNVPTIWQRKSAAEFYIRELERLGNFLTQFSKQKPAGEKLAETMISFENQRHRRQSAQPKSNHKIPLALIGSHLLKQDNIIFDIVQKYDSYIALDATADGERTLPGKFNHERLTQYPLEELAWAYFETIPDIFQRPTDRFYEWLKKKLHEIPVRGILFHHYVWCDKWHAELAQMCDKKFTTLPVLDISAGDNDTNSQSRLTARIQAFTEMLR